MFIKYTVQYIKLTVRFMNSRMHTLIDFRSNFKNYHCVILLFIIVIILISCKEQLLCCGVPLGFTSSPLCCKLYTYIYIYIKGKLKRTMQSSNYTLWLFKSWKISNEGIMRVAAGRERDHRGPTKLEKRRNIGKENRGSMWCNMLAPFLPCRSPLL